MTKFTAAPTAKLYYSCTDDDIVLEWSGSNSFFFLNKIFDMLLTK